MLPNFYFNSQSRWMELEACDVQSIYKYVRRNNASWQCAWLTRSCRQLPFRGEKWRRLILGTIKLLSYCSLLTNTYICNIPILIIQCVHKVPSGFWNIVARKQIELATCGLQQIIVKFWKVSFAASRWHKRPSLRFSVSCFWNGDYTGTRALCRMVFFGTKLVTHTQRN
jgi:hypothetical protein